MPPGFEQYRNAYLWQRQKNLSGRWLSLYFLSTQALWMSLLAEKKLSVGEKKCHNEYHFIENNPIFVTEKSRSF